MAQYLQPNPKLAKKCRVLAAHRFQVEDYSGAKVTCDSLLLFVPYTSLISTLKSVGSNFFVGADNFDDDRQQQLQLYGYALTYFNRAIEYTTKPDLYFYKYACEYRINNLNARPDDNFPYIVRLWNSIQDHETYNEWKDKYYSDMPDSNYYQIFFDYSIQSALVDASPSRYLPMLLNCCDRLAEMSDAQKKITWEKTKSRLEFDNQNFDCGVLFYYGLETANAALQVKDKQLLEISLNRYFENAIKKAKLPGSKALICYNAYMYEYVNDIHDFERACEFIKRAVEFSPNDPDYQECFGYTFVQNYESHKKQGENDSENRASNWESALEYITEVADFAYSKQNEACFKAADFYTFLHMMSVSPGEKILKAKEYINKSYILNPNWASSQTVLKDLMWNIYDLNGGQLELRTFINNHGGDYDAFYAYKYSEKNNDNKDNIQYTANIQEYIDLLNIYQISLSNNMNIPDSLLFLRKAGRKLEEFTKSIQTTDINSSEWVDFQTSIQNFLKSVDLAIKRKFELVYNPLRNWRSFSSLKQAKAFSSVFDSAVNLMDHEIFIELNVNTPNKVIRKFSSKFESICAEKIRLGNTQYIQDVEFPFYQNLKEKSRSVLVKNFTNQNVKDMLRGLLMK